MLTPSRTVFRDPRRSRWNEQTRHRWDRVCFSHYFFLYLIIYVAFYSTLGFNCESDWTSLPAYRNDSLTRKNCSTFRHYQCPFILPSSPVSLVCFLLRAIAISRFGERRILIKREDIDQEEEREERERERKPNRKEKARDSLMDGLGNYLRTLPCFCAGASVDATSTIFLLLIPLLACSPPPHFSFYRPFSPVISVCHVCG